MLLSQGSIIDLDGTFFVQLALFAVAFFLLRALVFRPALGVIEQRRIATEGAQHSAEDLIAKADAQRQAYEDGVSKALKTAQSERKLIIDEARSSVETRIRRVEADSDAVVAREFEQATAEARQSETTLQASVDDYADRIAAKMLGGGKRHAA